MREIKVNLICYDKQGERVGASKTTFQMDDKTNILRRDGTLKSEALDECLARTGVDRRYIQTISVYTEQNLYNDDELTEDDLDEEYWF